MKIYKGQLKQFGSWHQRGNSQGGVISFLIVGDSTLRNIGCDNGNFDYLATLPYGTNVKVYTQYILLFGTQLVGIKNLDSNTRFTWPLFNLIASMIFSYIIFFAIGWVLSHFIGKDSAFVSFLLLTVLPLVSPALALWAYARMKND